MPRTELPEEVDELTPEQIQELQPDANELAVEQLFEQAASENDWKYRVLRKTGESSRDVEFVMEAMPSDFPSQTSLELYLSQNYGGGKYRVLVYFRGKLKRNLELRIAESKLKAPLQAGGFDAAGAKIAQVLERMISTSNEQHTREMAALRADLALQRSQPAPDPFAQLEKLTTVLRNLQPPAASAPSATGGFSDMLRFMDLQDKLEARVLERVRDPDREPGILDLLNNAPKIIESLGSLRGVPSLPAPPATGANADAPTPVLPDSSPVPTGEPMTVDDFTRLIPLFTVLQGQAEADNDPETYAALILDNADRVAGPGTLERLLAMPDLQSRIEKAYPLAATRKQWWKELIDLLREPDEEAPVDATGPASDDSTS